LPEVEKALLILAKDNELVEKIINDLFLRNRYHFENVDALRNIPFKC